MVAHQRRGGAVKHQYVGDVNDYRKYALLRALAAGGTNRIGVCWMLTPSDERSDGNRLHYLAKPKQYRHFDPALFDILRQFAAEPDTRRLDAIEAGGTVPGAIYFNDVLPDDLEGRQSFMVRCALELHEADLVFFDPDNGLETKLPKGRKNSNKYLYLDEVTAFYGAGKSLLIYQHFPRITRSAFVATRVDQLRRAAPGAGLWTFTTAHVVFLLLIHPESRAGLAVAATENCARWDAKFVSGQYVGAGRDSDS
jgi:hypothetical protein